MGLLKPLALEMLCLYAPSRVLGLCSPLSHLACRDLQKVIVVSASLSGQLATRQAPSKHPLNNFLGELMQLQ